MSPSSDAPVDVLVIGAGPSGAVITHTLASQGFDVLCLEQGDWINPSEFPVNSPDWELTIQRQWSHEPNVRQWPADYPLELSDSEMSPIMYNAVGGGSLFYGAEFPRLLPSDFRVRSLDGVADDWPIDYEELKPYHDATDEFLGVSALGGNTAYPPGLEYPLPPHPLGKAGRRAAESANKLGWHWWPGANSIASYKHKTLEPCARWGVCEWGCPEGAKASFDLIYMPQALKAGAKLTTGARVRKVVTGADGLAEGALWIDRDGNEHLQKARVVVLCANGIGTARLLLLSADQGSHPDGLANSSGLVGRNLMLHPNCAVMGYYDDELDSWRGPAGELVNSMEFYDTRSEHDFVRGAKMQALTLPGPLTAVEFHRHLGFDNVWGESFHEVARRHARGLLWCANSEDLPEESNRITLDDRLTDGDGIPAPRVHYKVSENTRKILKFTVERMEELHTAGGAVETFATELVIDQPGHLLGTARMGDDPERSVTDSFGRCHDIDNLFIADGSLMVTSGAANPTSTIAALALRVGRHIAETAKVQAVPSASA